MMLNLLVLRCESIDKTRCFYENFGFVFVKEQHGNGPVHYSTKVQDIVLELYPASQAFPVDKCRLGFSLSSSNFEYVSHHFETKIITRDDRKILLIRDPDFRWVEVIS